MMRRLLRHGLACVAVAVLFVAGPSSASGASYAAIDHFGRNVSNGWGDADPGGPYSIQGTAADYWVSNASYARGLGYIRSPGPGASRSAILRQTTVANVEIGLSAYQTGVAGDGPFQISAVARSSSSGEVRAKLTYYRDCRMAVVGSVVADGRERQLSSAVYVPGARWCGSNSNGRTFALNAQVIGSTMRIKAWAAGSSPPSNWLWSATSSLPASGAVGLRTYVSSSAAGGATFVFYNWTARIR
jgi:hypothetical protein